MSLGAFWLWLASALAGSNLSAAQAPLVAEPAFQRIDVAFGETRTVHLSVHGSAAATLLAVDTDCSCIRSVTPPATPMTASAPLDLELRVTGVASGIKPVTVRTTVGSATVSLQLVVSGTGVGRDELAAAAKLAVERRERAVLLVHDLRGQLRNCGCSAGALGGIDRLAPLPAAWRAAAPGIAARFVLTGDIDGDVAGVGNALVERGWQRGDPAIAVGGDIAAAVADARLSAVVVTAPVELQHRRIVRPTLSGGMTVTVLLLDNDGQIDQSRVVPIDSTLGVDASILAGFPEQLTHAVVPLPASDSCMACHAGAHATWSASAHARAWAALTPANRTDGCVDCHSTRLDRGQTATGVHCQACHAGSQAHVADPTHVHLGSAVDCRTCHDARHHPEFDRMKAWDVIVHGR